MAKSRILGDREIRNDRHLSNTSNAMNTTILEYQYRKLILSTFTSVFMSDTIMKGIFSIFQVGIGNSS